MGEPLLRREVSIMSPLRYPGAKRRLSGYIAEALVLNRLRPKLLVEPFAGGASVSLELLSRKLVDSIAIGERDPLVASFWKIVFKDPEWPIRQIETVAVTLAAWDYFRNGRFRTDRELRVGVPLLEPDGFSGYWQDTQAPSEGANRWLLTSLDAGSRLRRFPAVLGKLLQ